MHQSSYDPCLLYCNNNGSGVVGMQTDDTLLLADKTFAEAEENKLQEAGFLSKNREVLTPASPIKFNGGLIEQEGNNINLTQERHCRNMGQVSPERTNLTSSRGITRNSITTKGQYIALRARGAYVATVCQPEAAYDLSAAAQVTDPKEEDIKKLNKRLAWQSENASRGLRFVPLNVNTDSLRLLVFTDASFANNTDCSSQIGYVIVLADNNDQANILHWSSVKCKRITRSVLASELYGMAHGFDTGAAIKCTIEKMIKIENLPLNLCTDSKSLYECLVKLGTTQEKRLMIDILCLRQAYERRLITEVVWIDRNTNPADAMTKLKSCQALRELINTNKVNIKLTGWVERGRSEERGDTPGRPNREPPVCVQAYSNICPFPPSPDSPLFPNAAPVAPVTHPGRNTKTPANQNPGCCGPHNAHRGFSRPTTTPVRCGLHRTSRPIGTPVRNPPVRDRTTGGSRDEAEQRGYAVK